mgnify:CR=1 FL=1
MPGSCVVDISVPTMLPSMVTGILLVWCSMSVSSAVQYVDWVSHDNNLFIQILSATLSKTVSICHPFLSVGWSVLFTIAQLAYLNGIAWYLRDRFPSWMFLRSGSLTSTIQQFKLWSFLDLLLVSFCLHRLRLQGFLCPPLSLLKSGRVLEQTRHLVLGLAWS